MKIAVYVLPSMLCSICIGIPDFTRSAYVRPKKKKHTHKPNECWTRKKSTEEPSVAQHTCSEKCKPNLVRCFIGFCSVAITLFYNTVTPILNKHKNHTRIWTIRNDVRSTQFFCSIFPCNFNIRYVTFTRKRRKSPFLCWFLFGLVSLFSGVMCKYIMYSKCIKCTKFNGTAKVMNQS